MRILIVTIFPEIFDSFVKTSLISKAIEKNLLVFSFLQIRDFASPPHYRVDDTPYGGGPGMVMMAEPLVKAIEDAKKKLPNAQVILLSASGKQLTQKKSVQLSKLSDLILVCGRYEGIDQRVIDLCIDEEISIGQYIVMGGEIPAMVLIESFARIIPGVIGNPDSVITESFSNTETAELESPQYTKPREFRGLSVPEVLLSGDHKAIDYWKKKNQR